MSFLLLLCHVCLLNDTTHVCPFIIFCFPHQKVISMAKSITPQYSVHISANSSPKDSCFMPICHYCLTPCSGQRVQFFVDALWCCLLSGLKIDVTITTIVLVCTSFPRRPSNINMPLLMHCRVILIAASHVFCCSVYCCVLLCFWCSLHTNTPQLKSCTPRL